MGVSREWISKLERGKEEPSELMRIKLSALEQQLGLHKREADTGFSRNRPPSIVGEDPATFGGVASKITSRREPSTRQDCEAYFAELLDRAEATENPNAFPVIHELLSTALRAAVEKWEKETH